MEPGSLPLSFLLCILLGSLEPEKNSPVGGDRSKTQCILLWSFFFFFLTKHEIISGLFFVFCFFDGSNSTIYLFFNLKIYTYRKVAKIIQRFSYSLHPASPNGNVLHNHVTVI